MMTLDVVLVLLCLVGGVFSRGDSGDGAIALRDGQSREGVVEPVRRQTAMVACYVVHDLHKYPTGSSLSVRLAYNRLGLAGATAPYLVSRWGGGCPHTSDCEDLTDEERVSLAAPGYAVMGVCDMERDVGFTVGVCSGVRHHRVPYNITALVSSPIQALKSDHTVAASVLPGAFSFFSIPGGSDYASAVVVSGGLGHPYTDPMDLNILTRFGQCPRGRKYEMRGVASMGHAAVETAVASVDVCVPEANKPQPWYLAVVGFVNGSMAGAIPFEVTARRENFRMLTSKEPVNGDLLYTGVEYFVFDVPHRDRDFLLSFFGASHTPHAIQLFAKEGSCPSPMDYTETSEAGGSLHWVSIPCMFANSGERYYVGVRNRLETRRVLHYNLTATLDEQVNIPRGIHTLHGTVLLGTMAFYVLQLPGNNAESLWLHINATTPAPSQQIQLYLRNVLCPSYDAYDYTDLSDSGPWSLDVLAGDMPLEHPWVVLGVRGGGAEFSVPFTLTIEMTESDHRDSLIHGDAQARGIASGRTIYHWVKVDKSPQTTSIIVQATTEHSLVSLRASKGTCTTPAADVLVDETPNGPWSLDLCKVNDEDVGLWCVGVSAKWTLSFYKLVVVKEDRSLNDGQIRESHISQGHWRFFNLPITEGTSDQPHKEGRDITVRDTAGGHVELFVQREACSTDVDVLRETSVGSADQGETAIVRIGACQLYRGHYTVGVVGRGPGTTVYPIRVFAAPGNDSWSAVRLGSTITTFLDLDEDTYYFFDYRAAIITTYVQIRCRMSVPSSHDEQRLVDLWVRKGQCPSAHDPPATRRTYIIPPRFNTSEGRWFIRIKGNEPRGVRVSLSLTEICPNICSGRGTCDPDTGRCQCELRYRGEDCSITAGLMDFLLEWFLSQWQPERRPAVKVIVLVLFGVLCMSVCWHTGKGGWSRFERWRGRRRRVGDAYTYLALLDMRGGRGYRQPPSSTYYTVHDDDFD